MKVVADLHIHSKYSRAVSPEMTIPRIWEWGKRKGIGLVSTGDWTHPLWMREIKANLEETGNGLLRLKVPAQGWSASGGKSEKFKEDDEGPDFLLATEISSIYSQGGRGHRIHNLVWSPSIATADKINKELVIRGANLLSDGRPIVGLTSMEIAELVFSIDPTCLLIPAHVWTPWFSLYGSESGFDSIDECFGQFAKYIYAVETGLSSDPSMNWRIKELDERSIISCSDAHSGPKLGREATVFELKELSYSAIREAIMGKNIGFEGSEVRDQGSGEMLKPNSISYTIEFHPEEGKYHFTGHRNCGIKQDPLETKKKGVICPVCGRKLTIGVMHRVEQLAGRGEEELKISNFKFPALPAGRQISNEKGIKMIKSDAFPDRPPYVKMVPLQEILAEAIGGSSSSKKVQDEYQKLTDVLGSEFEILLATKSEEIGKLSGAKVAEAIEKVRSGDIIVDPGYDGVFGIVKIWGEKNSATGAQNQKEETKEQMSLF